MVYQVPATGCRVTPDQTEIVVHECSTRYDRNCMEKLISEVVAVAAAGVSCSAKKSRPCPIAMHLTLIGV